MVTPPVNKRLTVEGSTLIASAMYDEAAERIYVWEHSGRQWAFEDCSLTVWELFLVPGASTGEYVMNVLKRHPHSYK